MNVAVLSDIHGNHLALEACIDYLEDKNIDAFFFLGDYTGEFPGIEQTMQMIYKLQAEKRCYFLRGNKEDYQLMGLGQGHPEWDAYPSTIGMLRYAEAHLTQRDLEFFKNLPITLTIKLEGMPEIVICHGSPRKVNEKFLESDKLIEEVLAEVEADYIICGHTHRTAEVTRGTKHIWNPGSVGMPSDVPYGFRFLILHGDDGKWIPQFVFLRANTEQILQKMRQAGLFEIAPYWTRLTEYMVRNGNGKHTHGSVLNRAMELCKGKYGKCVWPKVPEECFRQAFEELEQG